MSVKKRCRFEHIYQASTLMELTYVADPPKYYLYLPTIEGMIHSVKTDED
jgi:hypothetical protein